MTPAHFPSSGEQGATLVELLISLSILGVMLVILLGALRIGIRAWETGERDVEAAQRLQTVLSLLKRQLSSADAKPLILPADVEAEGTKPLVFRGDDHSLDYIAAVSLVPGSDAGRVQVRYEAAEEETGQALILTEQPAVSAAVDADAPEAGSPSAHRLLFGAHAIGFGYLDQTPEGGEWLPEWPPEGREGLPAAVRLTVQMAETNPVITVIARLAAEGEGP